MNAGVIPDASGPMHGHFSLLSKFGGPSIVLLLESKVRTRTTSSISRIVHCRSVFKFIDDMTSACHRGSEARHAVINAARLRSRTSYCGLDLLENGMY